MPPALKRVDIFFNRDALAGTQPYRLLYVSLWKKLLIKAEKSLFTCRISKI